jgi:hypothetical protein
VGCKNSVGRNGATISVSFRQQGRAVTNRARKDLMGGDRPCFQCLELSSNPRGNSVPLRIASISLLAAPRRSRRFLPKNIVFFGPRRTGFGSNKPYEYSQLWRPLVQGRQISGELRDSMEGERVFWRGLAPEAACVKASGRGGKSWARIDGGLWRRDRPLSSREPSARACPFVAPRTCVLGPKLHPWIDGEAPASSRMCWRPRRTHNGPYPVECIR